MIWSSSAFPELIGGIRKQRAALLCSTWAETNPPVYHKLMCHLLFFFFFFCSTGIAVSHTKIVSIISLWRATTDGESDRLKLKKRQTGKAGWEKILRINTVWSPTVKHTWLLIAWFDVYTNTLCTCVCVPQAAKRNSFLQYFIFLFLKKICLLPLSNFGYIEIYKYVYLNLILVFLNYFFLSTETSKSLSDRQYKYEYI